MHYTRNPRPARRACPSTWTRPRMCMDARPNHREFDEMIFVCSPVACSCTAARVLSARKLMSRRRSRLSVRSSCLWGALYRRIQLWKTFLPLLSRLCAVLLVALNLSDASCTRDMKATLRLDHPANMCAARSPSRTAEWLSLSVNPMPEQSVSRKQSKHTAQASSRSSVRPRHSAATAAATTGRQSVQEGVPEW